MAEDTAMVSAVGRSTAPKHDEERSRGPGSWEVVQDSKVKRARALLRDPDYPSKATLDAVAGLLARHLGAKPRPK